MYDVYIVDVQLCDVLMCIEFTYRADYEGIIPSSSHMSTLAPTISLLYLTISNGSKTGACLFRRRDGEGVRRRKVLKSEIYVLENFKKLRIKFSYLT